MLKACEEFLRVNKNEKIMTIFGQKNILLRDASDPFLVKGLGEYKKKEMIENKRDKISFKFWDNCKAIYETAKKYNVQFFHDFYEYEDQMVANNCYNETHYLSESVLDDVYSLLYYLKNSFTNETKYLFNKLDTGEYSIIYDGTCLELTSEDFIYPILMITEEV